jgi:hypothetical protein
MKVEMIGFDMNTDLDVTFADKQMFLLLTKSIMVRVTDTKQPSLHSFSFRIPKGTASDGASRPLWSAWLIGEKTKQHYIRAALVHDFLCREKTLPQRLTHGIFKELLKQDGVNLVTRNLMYAAVVAYNKVGNLSWKW